MANSVSVTVPSAPDAGSQLAPVIVMPPAPPPPSTPPPPTDEESDVREAEHTGSSMSSDEAVTHATDLLVRELGAVEVAEDEV